MSKVPGPTGNQNLEKITGQVIIRETGAKAPDGRKIIMLCSLVAVPDDSPLLGEHKYTLSGRVDDVEGVSLRIYPESAEDMSSETQGDTPSGWFTKPIWRV